jgi:16S rRNA (guanine527-N7)-methyltransferase
VRALVAHYGLGPDAGHQLEALLICLAADPHAPTAVRDPARAVDVHVADSLAALGFDQARRAATIADLGSGAGFPGLPLAVARPEAGMRLIESSARKCAFLARAVAAMGAMSHVEVVPRRAEEWTQGIGANELVVARAVAPLAVVVEYAAPLLAQTGALLAWRGRRNRDEERHATRAAHELGLEAAEVRKVTPFAGAQARHLHLYLKVRPTPSGFPRRPGRARRRPLGNQPPNSEAQVEG